MGYFIHGRHTGPGGRAAGTIDDFIHGRQGALWMTSSMDSHRGRETKGFCLGPTRTCWHMQTENSGIEILQNNNINHGCFMESCCCFVMKEKCLQLEAKSSFGHMQFDANDKNQHIAIDKTTA
jgi:hypothetical protein